MTMRRVFLSLCLLTGILGCSSMTVSSDYDPTVRFASYTTFSWMASPPHPARDRSAYDDLVAQWIRQDVERILSAKGFRKVTTGAPDLLVVHAFGIQDKQQVSRDFRTYYWWRWGTLRSVTVEDVRIRAYEEGTVSIGMFDPARQRLVWYGGAATEVDSPKDDKATIQGAVEKILAAFPPLPPLPEPSGE